jgi:hypothetical protein
MSISLHERVCVYVCMCVCEYVFVAILDYFSSFHGLLWLIAASALASPDERASEGAGDRKRKASAGSTDSARGRGKHNALVQPSRTPTVVEQFSGDVDDEDDDVAENRQDDSSVVMPTAGPGALVTVKVRKAKIRGPRGKRIKLSHNFRKK